jgi:tRNA (mo5U34)-methyltransferase
MLRSLRNLVNRLRRRPAADDDTDPLPLSGFEAGRHAIPYVDVLPDADLAELNRLLRWNCFTVDRHGRRFGNRAYKGKRDTPQEVPDRRIVMLNDRFALGDKHVLEVGCFEGVHTVALCGLARSVAATDARMENLVKTIVRCAFYGKHPTVFQWEVERDPPDVEWIRADILHHVGVLYHLRDPVGHLRRLAPLVRRGILLDTHYALDAEATLSYEAGGRTYSCKRYAEQATEVFAGVYDHAKWLRLGDLEGVLRDEGFRAVDVIEKRDERNGPRVLLMAER